MYYVYLLSSLNHNWVYIGCTDDLRQRFDQHQKLQVCSTKSHAPFKLVYYEAYLNKTDARCREIELKTNSQQKEKLLKRIANSII